MQFSPYIYARAILQRLGDVRRGARLGLGEIGDGARQLERVVEGAGGELEALGGVQEQGRVGSPW